MERDSGLPQGSPQRLLRRTRDHRTQSQHQATTHAIATPAVERRPHGADRTPAFGKDSLSTAIPRSHGIARSGITRSNPRASCLGGDGLSFTRFPWGIADGALIGTSTRPRRGVCPTVKLHVAHELHVLDIWRAHASLLSRLPGRHAHGPRRTVCW